MNNEGQGEDTPQGENTGINPAWNEFLELVPEDQHSQATEILSKWDKGVQERFTARAQEIEQYKPLIENKIPFEQIDAGMQLMKFAQENPDELFKALAQQIGQENAQQLLGIAPADQDTPELPEELKGLENHPFIKKLQEQLDSVNTVVASTHEEQLVEQELTKIADEIASLSNESHFNRELTSTEEEIVIKLMLNGDNIEQAYTSLKSLIGESGTAPREKPNAPKVLNGQGGVPQGNVDPRKMTESQRRLTAIEQLKLQNAADRE